MDDLVHEITFTMDKLCSRINEEREKINDFKKRHQETMTRKNEVQQYNNQLKAEIDHLKKTIYRESEQTEQLSKATILVQQRVQSLNKALAEIEQADAKMQTEKSKLLQGYRESINSYENCIQQNHILRDFVEDWRCQVTKNKELVMFPAVICNLAKSLEKFYACDIVEEMQSLVTSSRAQANGVTSPNTILEVAEDIDQSAQSSQDALMKETSRQTTAQSEGYQQMAYN